MHRLAHLAFPAAFRLWCLCLPAEISRLPARVARRRWLWPRRLGFAIWLNYFRYADPEEEYVYVQTFTDMNKLMDPLNRLVERNPANYQMTGSIVMDSYHPLPWLLGDFPQIGYYGEDLSPQKMDADFLLVEESRIDDVEAGAEATNILRKT